MGGGAQEEPLQDRILKEGGGTRRDDNGRRRCRSRAAARRHNRLVLEPAASSRCSLTPRVTCSSAAPKSDDDANQWRRRPWRRGMMHGDVVVSDGALAAGDDRARQVHLVPLLSVSLSCTLGDDPQCLYYTSLLLPRIAHWYLPPSLSSPPESTLIACLGLLYLYDSRERFSR
jgi:hypothetical protein